MALPKINPINFKIPGLTTSPKLFIESDYHELKEYIEKYWDVLVTEQKQDQGSAIGLPHKFVVPSKSADADFQYHEQYYWDSYFTAIGLIESGRNQLAEGMLDNLLFLLDRFGYIPNASRYYLMSHSQPPLLTSFIFLIYKANQKPLDWLAQKIEKAEEEYLAVWMSKKHPYWHNVHKDLSRYYDINVLHDLAEAESGWDMTPRFSRKALDFLPIDLNSLLYQYEKDFENAYTLIGNLPKAKHYRQLSDKRKQNVNRLMYDNLKKMYFDYNYVSKTRSRVWSAAAYTTLWSGLADPKQADGLIKNSQKFIKKGGFITTTKPLISVNIFGSVPTQWAYPNGWAPLQYFAYQGLKNYNQPELAKTIAVNWVNAVNSWFKSHHEILEKYNVISPQKTPLEGVYPTQKGFGWSNAITLYFLNQLAK